MKELPPQKLEKCQTCVKKREYTEYQYIPHLAHQLLTSYHTYPIFSFFHIVIYRLLFSSTYAIINLTLHPSVLKSFP